MKNKLNLANKIKHKKNTNKEDYSGPNKILYKIKQRYKESEDEKKLNLNSVKDDYFIYINDNSVINPFGIDQDILTTVKNQTRNCNTLESKAKKLFGWFEENISYQGSDRGYSTGQELFQLKEGICGEMAFLYVTMARSINLKSNYVSIKKDNYNKKVDHACASVEVERGIILVDPAYHGFDIKHKDYKINTDKYIMRLFEIWRKT